jgi:predicted metal-binding membrane protein
MRDEYRIRISTPGSALGIRAGSGALIRFGVPLALLLLAALGWWWSLRMEGEMGAVGPSGMDAMDDAAMASAMSFGAFLVAWIAMMAAMMLPAVLPVVRLYGRAATAGRAAPLPFFVAGYLGLWIVTGLPAYLAWDALEDPIAAGATWTGRLAGAALLVASAWQLTPLKSWCLRHCRSPMSFFMRYGNSISTPAGALRMGLGHAAFCIGCCWTLFVVLVTVGTMNIAWMVALAALIVLERNAPRGEQIAKLSAGVLGGLGAALLLAPSIFVHIT